MKTSAIWLVVPVLGVATWLGATPQKPGGRLTRIGYVSSQRISSETNQGRAGVAKVQTLQRERTAEVRQKQQALEATRSQLALATAEGRAKLAVQESQQRADLERTAARAQIDVQVIQRQVNAEVLADVKEVMAGIAKDQGIDIVLNLESVVWADENLDVTDAVIAKMNAALAPGEKK